ncbi:MAG: winged helix-turn-helix transcriptional regulator [Candidatus Thorarchaeota archaeon]
MDRIDKGILSDLAANCRTTFGVLSKRYGISSSAIKKRVKKLEESGVIFGYTLLFSRAMIGANPLFGLLETDGSQDEEEFVLQLGQNDKIIAAASYSGAHYALVAEYRNSQELWDIGAYLRSFNCVERVEMHQLLDQPGDTMNLSRLHLRLINYLIDDPRMSIASLAEKAGFTAKRARKLVNELVESNAIYFRALLELDAAGSIPFLARITWNEKAVDHNVIVKWLKETFPLTLWETYISVGTPIIICLITGNNLREVDLTTRSIRRHEHIQTVRVLINKHHKYFTSNRHKAIRELLEREGIC